MKLRAKKDTEIVYIIGFYTNEHGVLCAIYYDAYGLIMHDRASSFIIQDNPRSKKNEEN